MNHPINRTSAYAQLANDKQRIGGLASMLKELREIWPTVAGEMITEENAERGGIMFAGVQKFFGLLDELALGSLEQKNASKQNARPR